MYVVNGSSVRTSDLLYKHSFTLETVRCWSGAAKETGETDGKLIADSVDGGMADSSRQQN